MITAEDLKNLEVVFAYARQTVINNKQELIEVLKFEEQLFEKLKKKETFTEKTKKVLAKK